MTSLSYKVRFHGTKLITRLFPMGPKTLFQGGRSGYYTSAGGHTKGKFVPFTKLAEHVYLQLFEILRFHNIEFAVFEGTPIGFIRDGNPLPWMDDVDILIFEDQIERFEKMALPYLRDCGFYCVPQANYPGGGFQIFGLLGAGGEGQTANFSEDISLEIRQVHMDVFYTEIDAQGYLRNKGGWGVYHEKNVPASLAKPFQEVRMFGTRVPFLAEYEDVVAIEYGDIMKEVVVLTHSRYFLRNNRLGWERFIREFSEIIDKTGASDLPTISHAQLADYRPQEGMKQVGERGDSLEKMVQRILVNRAEWLVIPGSNAIFWVMDLKRLLPGLKIQAKLQTTFDITCAAHLRAFIDEVEIGGSDLRAQYDLMTTNLRAATGW